MVEIGIDIWQGVIAQNDIVEIQRITEGKLAMVGGIDGPKIDVENITEEQIRAEVRRAVDTYRPDGSIRQFRTAGASWSGTTRSKRTNSKSTAASGRSSTRSLD